MEVGWIDLAQDKEMWWAFVNTVMNIQVPLHVRNFLTSWGPVRLSRTQLHAVGFLVTWLGGWLVSCPSVRLTFAERDSKFPITPDSIFLYIATKTAVISAKGYCWQLINVLWRQTSLIQWTTSSLGAFRKITKSDHQLRHVACLSVCLPVCMEQFSSPPEQISVKFCIHLYIFSKIFPENSS